MYQCYVTYLHQPQGLFLNSFICLSTYNVSHLLNNNLILKNEPKQLRRKYFGWETLESRRSQHCPIKNYKTENNLTPP